MMHSRFLTTTALLLAVVLLFAANIVSNTLLGGARVDLTENKLYTLSQGTRNILAKLDEPITLRLYVSKGRINRIPSLASYAQRVESMLTEYERLSAGRLVLHTIDPEPFSEEEDRAVAYGVRGLPAGGDEHLYFGVVGTNAVGAEESIPLLSVQRELFLEYDLMRLIVKLTDAERTVIGLLTSLPIDGGGARSFTGANAPRWAIVDQMRQQFDLRTLPLELHEVAAEIDVLLLIHPQNLTDSTLYAIDQYVLRGGKLLAFVDGHAESQPQPPPTGAALVPPSRRSQIDKLLTAWGLVLAPDTVVADLQNAVAVQMQQGDKVVAFDYPLWLNIRPDNFNRDDPVTAELANVTFGSAGLLTVDATASAAQPGPQITPLIRTSTAPAVFSQAELAGHARDPRQLLNAYQSLTAAFNLAVRISGVLNSAFAEPPPQSVTATPSTTDAAMPDTARSDKAHLSRSLAGANLIVVADVDMLSDRFWVQVQDILGSRIAIPSAANGAFLINALDNLAGSSDLISIRSRGRFVRPFDRIDALRRQTELIYRDKEQELAQQLQETENNLLRLEESNQSAIAGVLSAEQQQELQSFRVQRLRIRGELREVRLQLRRSIQSLEDRLKFINIGLAPLLIGIGGLCVGMWRLRKRKMRLQIA